MELKKRSRMRNFTSYEEHLLLSLVIANKSVVENKKTDSVSNAKKEQCFKQFAKKFDQLGYKRNHVHLKTKWDGMKKLARRRAALVRQAASRDGGNPSEVPTLSSFDRKILRHILPNGCDGIEDDFDSDVVELLENDHDSYVNDRRDVPTVVKQENEEEEDEEAGDLRSWNRLDESYKLPESIISVIAASEAGTNGDPTVDTCEPGEWDFEPTAQTPSPARRKRKRRRTDPEFEELLKCKVATAKVDLEIKLMEKSQKARADERTEELHQMQLKMLQAELVARMEAERRVKEKHDVEMEILIAQANKIEAT